MNIIKSLKRITAIDFGNLSNNEKELIHQQFTEECLSRINWVSAIVFFGEIILVFLDLSSGFFKKNQWNILNFVAEMILILSSLIVNAACEKVIHSNFDNYKIKRKIIDTYKFLLFISVTFFIFTDIYVRHKPLGTYIVFLFIFQIIPFYRAYENIILYLSLAAMVIVTHKSFVPNAHMSTLFSTFFVFVAFALSTECLRSFFIKNLINNRMAQLLTERFENLASQTIISLSNAVEAKDLYTKGHSQRVAKYSKEIAKRMNFDEVKQNEIYYIGLLHDIGKIGIRDTVINKNGRLTDEEFGEIKKHPEMGYEILKNITEISDISLGAKWHHERYDGRGYPDGLSGEEIPIIARIIAVADSYDAMTSNRSYRNLLPQSKVREEIEKNIGKQFAPETAKIMIEMIDEDTKYEMHE